MQNIRTILVLLVFLTVMPLSAQAESAAPASNSSTEKTTVPANMSDDALASYISGRLAPLLKDAGYQVSQNCDSSGCSVIVQ